MKKVLVGFIVLASILGISKDTLAQSLIQNQIDMSKACDAMVLSPKSKKQTAPFTKKNFKADAAVKTKCDNALKTTEGFVPAFLNLSDNELFADLLGVTQKICTAANEDDLQWKKRRNNCYDTASEIVATHLFNFRKGREAVRWAELLSSTAVSCQLGHSTLSYLRECIRRCETISADQKDDCHLLCPVKTEDSVLDCHEYFIRSLKDQASSLAH